MPSALARINQSVWEDYLQAQDARLPALPPIEHLSTRVIRVLGGNAGLMRLQGTNTYIVGTGESRLLIDTGQGEPFWIDHVKKVLEESGLAISAVLLTHWHSDHTGGVPDLIAYRPEMAHRIYKCDPDRGQKGITDGQVFHVEGATVRAVFTPGHAHDHMCFKLDEENALFTGDNVLGHGQTVFEDLGLFTKSLDIMANLHCQLGYPAHGDVIRDLPSKMCEVVKQKQYRERQIYQGLVCSKTKAAQQASSGGKGKGSLAIPALVRLLYGEVEPEVYKLAIEPSVSCTLAKLAEDRKVGFEMVGGEKCWFVRENRTSRITTRRIGEKRASSNNMAITN